jgi:hypothetical protein
LSKLREEKRQPILAINPWAERPLPDALKALRRFEADNDLWVLRDDKILADVLGLPNPWPPDKMADGFRKCGLEQGRSAELCGTMRLARTQARGPAEAHDFPMS